MPNENLYVLMRSLGFTDAQIDRAKATTDAMSAEEQRVLIRGRLSTLLPDVPCSLDVDGDYHLDADALRRRIKRILS